MSLHLKKYIITITIWLLCMSTSTTYNCLTKISVQKPLNPLAEIFSPIGSTTSESILEMSNHSRSLVVSNDTGDIVSEQAIDASRSSSRNDDSTISSSESDSSESWLRLTWSASVSTVFAVGSLLCVMSEF
jgi:hypothetical protein